MHLHLTKNLFIINFLTNKALRCFKNLALKEDTYFFTSISRLTILLLEKEEGNSFDNALVHYKTTSFSGEMANCYMHLLLVLRVKA